MWEVKARWYLKKKGMKNEQKAPTRNCFNFCDDTMRKRTDVIMMIMIWVKTRLALYLYNANCKVDLEVPISLT